MVGSRDLANWEQLGGLERGMGRGGGLTWIEGLCLSRRLILGGVRCGTH